MIQRTLTAVVLLAGFVGALFWLPRSLFAACVALIAGLAGVEWARLSGLATTPGRLYGGAMVGAAAGLCWIAQSAPSGDRSWVIAVFAAATLFWAVIAPTWMALGVRATARPVLAGTGPVVILPAAVALLVLPPLHVLAVLALVWIADSAAYFAGRALGRHKLAPAISPGKTWEGAAAGLLGVQVYAIICALLIPALETRLEGSARWLLYLSGVSLLCAASVVGDLFESAMKRQASVKDSGTLLPGHGGMLDRIDSAVAVLPVAALMAHFLA